MEIPSVGTMSVMSDPQGAMFAAYQPSSVESSDACAEVKPGDFSWHELATTDPDAALAFYQRLFGWEKQGAHDMGHIGMYMRVRDPRPGARRDLYEAGRDDRAAGVALLRAHGGPCRRRVACQSQRRHGALEPIEVPGGDHIAVFTDQQGAFFALHQKKG